MDFLDRLKDHITANIVLNAPLKIGLLEPKGSAAAMRTVSSGVKARYLNGDTVYGMGVQILIQDADQKEAVKVLDNITHFIDRLTKDSITSLDGSFDFLSASVSVLPNFVQKTENDEYVYTAIYVAEIETKGV